jgi:hypothetical protein
MKELESGAVSLIAKKMGFETGQIQSVVKSLLPKATVALQALMSQPEKLNAIISQVMMGNFFGFLDDADKVGSQSSIDLGNNLLKQFFGDEVAVQKVTDSVAQETMISVSDLSKIIPALTTSVMAAVAKNAGAILMGSGFMGNNSVQQNSDNSAVTELLGGLLGGASKDGSLDIGALAASFLKK